MKQQRLLYFMVCMIALLPAYTGCNKKAFVSAKTEADTAMVIPPVNSCVAMPDTFGFGQLVSESYIQKFDIDVRPDGKGLPVGIGRVQEGRTVYLEKCTLCHGKTGKEGGLGGKLVSSDLDSNKTKTIGNYWPYATTVYDYIYRAMPYNEPGSLISSEVYDLTAYLLYANGIIDSTFLVTEKTLPAIEMPAKKLFVPDNRAQEIKLNNR